MCPKCSQNDPQMAHNGPKLVQKTIHKWYWLTLELATLGIIKWKNIGIVTTWNWLLLLGRRKSRRTNKMERRLYKTMDVILISAGWRPRLWWPKMALQWKGKTQTWWTCGIDTPPNHTNVENTQNWLPKTTPKVENPLEIPVKILPHTTIGVPFYSYSAPDICEPISSFKRLY